jgi:hypothetical protein
VVTNRSGRSLKIEILHFGGCPGSTETLDILRRVGAEEGIAINVAPVLLSPWDRTDFPGSPTILVDDEDIFPAQRYGTRAMSCRIYATSEGPKNHPTEAIVREALLGRSLA